MPSTTLRTLAEIESDLREKLPPEEIKVRPHDGIRYIPWTAAKDMGDLYAPGWTSAIVGQGVLPGNGKRPDRFFIEVQIGVPTADFGTVYRANIGFEEDTAGTGEASSSYGDPFTNAYAQAFKRTWAQFGVAYDLYDKDSPMHTGPTGNGAPANGGSAPPTGQRLWDGKIPFPNSKVYGKHITDPEVKIWDLRWYLGGSEWQTGAGPLAKNRDGGKDQVKFDMIWTEIIRRRLAGEPDTDRRGPLPGEEEAVASARKQPASATPSPVSAANGSAIERVITPAELADLIKHAREAHKLALPDIKKVCEAQFAKDDPKTLTVAEVELLKAVFLEDYAADKAAPF